MKAVLLLVSGFGFLGVCAPRSLYAQEPTVAEQGTLVLGERQERSLAYGTVHTWTLPVETGQYVEVAVEQVGVDVMIRVVDPAAAPHRDVDGPTRALGTERIRWIAASGGAWQVRVVPLSERVPGAYAITWTVQRAAEPPDRRLTETDSLYHQAGTAYAEGRLEQADTLYQQVLAAREEIAGSDALDVGEVLAAQGALFTYQDRYDEAEEALQRALSLYEQALGADHPDVWPVLARLADLYWYWEQYAESKAFYGRTLTIRERGLGTDHPDLVRTLLDLGWVYSAQDLFDEADALIQRAQSIQEQAFGPDHFTVGYALSEIGLIYSYRGSYPEAASTLERALAIQEQALGPTHPDVVTLFNSLAHVYVEQGRYDDAQALLERALAIQEQALGPTHPDVAIHLNRLGTVYVEQGRYDDAQALFERALRIFEQNAVPSVAQANLLDNLGKLYQGQGRYAAADSLFGRALTLAEQLLGPNHLSVATTLNNRAVLFTDQGRYEEADSLYQRSLKITEEALGTEHPTYATTLDNLAQLYDWEGRLAEAKTLYEQALAIREQHLGPEHPEVANSLNNVGQLYSSQGRYADAEPMLKRAIVLYERIYGPDHPRLATSLYNLASLYDTQGWYADAEPLYRKALEISERAFGLHHERVATALIGLASIYSAQSQYDEAEALYQRALTIREEVFGHEHANTAHVLNNLGIVYSLQKAYDQARPLVEEALAIQEKIFGPNHPSSRRLRDNLAAALLEQGQYEEAERLYQQTLTSFEQTDSEDPFATLPSLFGLAKIALKTEQEDLTLAFDRIDETIAILDAIPHPKWRIEAYGLRAQLYRQDGQPGKAIDDLAIALRATEDLRTQVGGGEQARAEFLTPYIRFFDWMIDWQLEAGNIKAAYEYAERGRARVLLDQLAAGKIDLRTSIPDDIRAELEARETEGRARLAEFQQRITLMRARTDLSTFERLRGLAALEDSLRAADRAYQQAYQDIKNASPLWRDLITAGGQPTALATIQEQLVPRDGLLLLYHIGHEHSYVFAVPPWGQETETFPLHVTEEQAAALQVTAGPLTTSLLQESLGVEESGETDGLMKALASRHQDAEALAERLHALWRVLVPPPLWTTLSEVSDVVIVPDALLHYLPFEALVVQPGAEDAVHYWLDAGPAIRYAPSATALYNIARRPAPRARPQAHEATVLSMSDPIFSPAEVVATLAAVPVRVRGEDQEDAVSTATRDSYERAGGSLVRLPGTARETEAIQAAYGEEADDAVLALQGLDASEPNLRAALAGKRYLHFGTHGLVDERRGALFASLAMTPPADEGAALENDGFLQLHEIYDLNLSEAELAVLSACESNIGPNIAGEGVFALSRGFFAAGARRVVASQWSVDDASTAALMGAFFERVVAAERSGRRMDFARALWDARKQVRGDARWSAPYFWAPFVLTGKQ